MLDFSYSDGIFMYNKMYSRRRFLYRNDVLMENIAGSVWLDRDDLRRPSRSGPRCWVLAFGYIMLSSSRKARADPCVTRRFPKLWQVLVDAAPFGKWKTFPRS